MTSTLLEQLSSMTVVVADTGDLEAIRTFQPRDATTNPSLILAAAKIPAYQNLIDHSLRSSRKRIGNNASPKEVVNEALDQICIVFGNEILKLIPGRVSTEVDARLSFDKEGTIEKARKLIALYSELGVSKDRILIKIASTWQGIKAAETLEKEGIHCNLTLLFNFCQAATCAEAGVTLISPFVGRILDWYKANTGRESYSGEEDPGVISVTSIFNYFKFNNYKTEVMGASFRNIEEIKELAGCDLLTISPKLLSQLNEDVTPLPMKLDAKKPNFVQPKVQIDQAMFKKMMNDDPMASEKLDEGIKNFSNAIEELELMLFDRLNILENDKAVALSV